MRPIYLLVGVPGSGKSWVCNQLSEMYEHIPHDDYMKGGYLEALLEASDEDGDPILAEAPFSVSQIKEPLEGEGRQVFCVFIIESHNVLSERYYEREGRPIPRGHLTRQETYRERASEYDSFMGTSEEVLEYLTDLCTSQATLQKKSA